MEDVKYPAIEVELIGQEGSAPSIIGRTMRALRRGGVPNEEITIFASEVTNGDYNHVLTTVQQWVTVL